MRIILIGFMGVGKTTVGKIIAKELNMDFIDMDDEIEKKEKSTITKIFEKQGETYFRNLETQVLKELMLEDNVVISTGGGIVTKEENYKILKGEKMVIYLDANCHTIIKHLSNETNQRPLLKNSLDLKKTISDLLNKRIERYNSISNIKIDVNNKNIEEVISQILVYIR